MTTGLAIGPSYANSAALGTLVYAAVSEGEMGADLNADGDLLDSVLHEIDTTDDSVRSLGLAVVGRIVASDKQIAFLVSEAGQAGTDLNLDGDFGDLVWFVFDPTRLFAPGTNPVNTAIAYGGGGAGTTGGFVLLESEAAAGADRNGDGDQLDIVPRVFDGGTFAISPLIGPAYAPATALVARNGRVLYAASEAAQGISLNGDPDALDFALHAIDFVPGLPTLRRIGGGAARAVANHPFALTDNAAVYFIDEASENGIDLNNDADANDAILAVYDLATGAGETRPFTPLIPTSFAVPCATSVGIGAGSTRAIVAVSEAGQKRDINNDFDQLDLILAWVDTTAPATLNLHVSVALAARTPAIDGTRGLVSVSEGASGFGGTDLNNDGDKNDAVLFLVDTATSPGAVSSFSLATQGYAISGADAFVGVDEAAQGIDLNGNSSLTDIVQFYIDLGDPVPVPRGLGIVATSGTFFRLSPQEVRVAAVLPEGQSASYGDLNKDGDTLDSALELISLNPSLTPPPFISPTPYFAGECSAGNSQPLRTGTATYVFPASEAMAGQDMNGDADLLDTVLCVTRIQ